MNLHLQQPLIQKKENTRETCFTHISQSHHLQVLAAAAFLSCPTWILSVLFCIILTHLLNLAHLSNIPGTKKYPKNCIPFIIKQKCCFTVIPVQYMFLFSFEMFFVNTNGPPLLQHQQSVQHLFCKRVELPPSDVLIYICLTFSLMD